MEQRLTRKCEILGLYLAARGSNNLWEFLRNLTQENLRAATDAWKPLGIDPGVIREVADYVQAEGDRKPVNKENPNRDPEPCPFPPCIQFVGAILDAVKNNVSG